MVARQTWIDKERTCREDEVGGLGCRMREEVREEEAECAEEGEIADKETATLAGVTEVSREV